MNRRMYIRKEAGGVGGGNKMEYDCNWRYPTIEYEEGKEIFLLEFFPLFFFHSPKIAEEKCGGNNNNNGRKKNGGYFFYRDTQHKERHPLLLITLFVFFFLIYVKQREEDYITIRPCFFTIDKLLKYFFLFFKNKNKIQLFLLSFLSLLLLEPTKIENRAPPK